jgi:hypothetical protein
MHNAALVATGKIHDVLELGRGNLARAIAGKVPPYRGSSRQDRLTNHSGISCCAVGFSTGFHRPGYAGLHVAHRLLRAASPSLSCRCRAIETLLQSAGEVVTCFLSRGRRKKQCKKRAYSNSYGKCSELV